MSPRAGYIFRAVARLLPSRAYQALGRARARIFGSSPSRNGGRLRLQGVRIAHLIVCYRIRGNQATLIISSADPSILTQAAHGARIAAHLRLPPLVLVLDYDPRVEMVVNRLPANVAVRRFWRGSVGGIRPRISDTGLSEGPVPSPDNGGGWVSGHYQHGLPALARVTRPEGDLIFHYGRQGKPIRREELDTDGNVARVVELHPETNRDVAYGYLDSDGEPWLTVWLDDDGMTPRKVNQHRPTEREYGGLAELHASWVADQQEAVKARLHITVGTGSRHAAAAFVHTERIHHFGV